MKPLRITQTLLSSWKWVYLKDDGYEEFLQTLNREKKPQTKAMLEGIRFENVLNGVLDGAPIDPKHEWLYPILEISDELCGASQQVTLFREIEVQGVPFLLHGVLDFLKQGIIYDTKFSTNYKVGKYLDSPQTSMYFALVPEARLFEYIISDGKYVYREKYPRYLIGDGIEPIERTIDNFMSFLDRQNLLTTFKENWEVKKEP